MLKMIHLFYSLMTLNQEIFEMKSTVLKIQIIRITDVKKHFKIMTNV